MSLTQNIKEKAVELGFDLVGIAPAAAADHADSLYRWIDSGYHGDMAWMGRDPARRADPEQVLPGARSVIVVGLSYYVADPPKDVWDDPMRGRIARYAWGLDYHDVMTPRLHALADFARQEAGQGATSKTYVDTGPVLEREVAARAGLGFVGKNTLLVSPSMGSFVFLGEVIINHALDYDEPAQDGGATVTMKLAGGKEQVGTCGTCRRCQDVCPTHAFPAPYILNSTKCISYLTIEQKGSIPVELRPLLGNWIYGCDECQSICPWVKQYSKPMNEAFLSYDPDVAAPRLVDIMAMDDEAFRKRFKGSPIKRTKRRGLLRNAAVALGNSGNREAIPVLEQACKDTEPLVREHALWAMERLSGGA